MEFFNKIFEDMYKYEGTHDYSMKPMAMGKSKSYVLSLLNDELETRNYTPADRKSERKLLKELISSKGSSQNVAELVNLQRPSRRPGEFTEIDFPKVSILTLKQMKRYTVLLEAKTNNRMDPKDEAEFEQLQAGVALEHAEFQEFARLQWHTKNFQRVNEIKPSVKNYIDDVWQSRISRLERQAPLYYELREQIPSTFNDVIDTENPVIFKMGEVIFATGTHNSFVVPPLLIHPREVTYLPTDCQTLTENRHPDHEFLPPVSEDKIVEHLLEESAVFKNEHAVVVLSASGLKAIADTHSVTSEWMLPITIKEITLDGNKKQKVIFIDKKLPPKNLSIVQRMQWYAKIATRMMLCKSNEKSDEAGANPSKSGDMLEGDDFGEGEMMDVDCGFNPISKCKVKRDPVWSAGYREYRVWQIGKETLNPLMKNQAGQIKILLRTKYDGRWERPKRAQTFIVAPKLDYQCEYGGDKLTTSECIRQWTDLHIRPGIFLKRARINPMTNEFMQLQTVDETDLLAEMSNFKNRISPHSIANSLYSITSRLTRNPPGKYILEHSTKLQGFCTLYVKCDENGHKPFELLRRYPEDASQAAPLELSAPFVPLDPTFKTSNHCYRSVLPLTFPPRANANPILQNLPKFVPGLRPKKKKKKNKPRKKRKKNAIDQKGTDATSS